MNKGFNEGIAIKKGYESAIDCLKREITDIGPASPTHYHDYVEILYGTDCDMTIWVNDHTLHFETGDLVIINPRETHTLFSHAKKCNYIVIKFMSDILQYDGQTPSETMYMLPIMHNSATSEHIIKHGELDDMYIKDIVNNIYTEWNEESFGYELAARAGILNLFLQTIRYLYSKNNNELFNETDEITSSIYKAAEYCTTHYTDITAKQLAEMSSMSYAYFSRTFKKIIGRSFSQYLNDVRIDNAKRILLTSSAAMAEIAADTGFSSASHFIHNFRLKTGVSPLVYKKEFKEKYLCPSE